MLIKHNFILNGGSLQSPEYIYSERLADVNIKNNKVYVNNLKTSMGGFTKDGLRESQLDLQVNKIYYAGFFGHVDGNIDIYKGAYKPYKTKGNFIYVEFKGEEIKGPIQIRSYDGANVVLENLCMFEGEIGDIFMPCIEDLPKDKQSLLPPEGEYKEIQPM